MARNDHNKNLKTVTSFVGEIRRSKLISTAGPGAIIDLVVRPSGEPVSGVVAGLEQWTDYERIEERRLQTRYNVKCLGMPPLRQRDDMNNDHTLPMVRFPGWLQCPSCKVLRPAEHWANNSSNHTHAGRYCLSCKTDRGDLTPVVPVRFITACEHGHLDDFPWKGWVGCTCSWHDTRLKLEQKGAGLAGLFLSCTVNSCPGFKGKSLEHIFGESGLASAGFSRCRGKRPWLGSDSQDEDCSATRRVLQRGASNVYWPSVDSALDIPERQPRKRPELDLYTNKYLAKSPEKRPGFIEALELEQESGLTATEIDNYYMGFAEQNTEDPLTFEEYEHFMMAKDGPIRAPEFELDSVNLPDEFRSTLGILVQAQKLREVRLLHGFTRIYPPTGAFSRDSVQRSSISLNTPEWLPAVELRGEGIFFTLDLNLLSEWEQRPCVQSRMDKLREDIQKNLFEKEEIPPDLSARMVLLHSLSHALMTQLTLSCGYSSASLVERIYAHSPTAQSPGPDMAGVLIHTGTPDADGTLGGLVEQGETLQFGQVLMDAISNNAWCSSDPLCISGTTALSSARNGAACHACLLIPETSCTMFNRYLDRAFLVGEPGCPELGFFAHLVGTVE